MRFTHAAAPTFALLLLGCSANDDAATTAPIGSADAGAIADGSTGDATPGPSPTDAGPPAPETVGVFVASGHAGRTIVSCDDGKTWRFDQSLDPNLRCFADAASDCDHHPGAARGLTYGNGWFFRTNGWGKPGAVSRSRNGIAWEPVTKDTTFGGVVFQNNIVVLGARTPQVSTNDGVTFTPGPDGAIQGWNVRRASVAGGLFWLLGDDGSDVSHSADGKSWTAVKNMPVDCGKMQGGGGFASIGATIVLAGETNVVCRSTDGGTTWTQGTFPGGAVASSPLLVTNGEFRTWGGGKMLTSKDGATWTATALTKPVPLGVVAQSAGGTYVSVRGGWQTWYEKQEFYRSTDGITWTTLPATDAPGGHPIGWMTWGRVPAELACVASK